MAGAVLVMAIATLMTAAVEAMVVAMITALVVPAMTIAATVALAEMTMALVELIATLLTVVMAVGTADAMTVEAVEVAITTGPLPQRLVPVATAMHLLRARRTAEDARTRVTTIALTASPLC